MAVAQLAELLIDLEEDEQARIVQGGEVAALVRYVQSSRPR